MSLSDVVGFLIFFCEIVSWDICKIKFSWWLPPTKKKMFIVNWTWMASSSDLLNLFSDRSFYLKWNLRLIASNVWMTELEWRLFEFVFLVFFIPLSLSLFFLAILVYLKKLNCFFGLSSQGEQSLSICNPCFLFISLVLAQI